jgi:catechol 2,3-dioxygenase-like lactoylglutathione lyase family enzyme
VDDPYGRRCGCAFFGLAGRANAPGCGDDGFYRDVLQLEVILERPGATWFRLGDGAEVHVYGPGDEDHDFFGSAPVIGFAVDSFPGVHAAMTAAGIEFIYPEPQRAGGRAWQHFRGPDGNIYEGIGPDEQGA